MSPIGYSLEEGIVAIGDTAHLNAYILDVNGQLFNPQDVVSVVFNIQAPDGTRNTYQGNIESDGTGTLNFNDTVIEGHYVAVASFSLADGSTKSTRTSFEVDDPFSDPLLFPTNGVEAVAQGVWAKLSDVFDDKDGGPWLRQMTERIFNPQRMGDFIAEAITDFNFSQPPTQFDLDTFTLTDDYANKPNTLLPLIIQGTYLAVLRHLMRSYVEQPNPQGAQFGWLDRRDYVNRYKLIYDQELEMYKKWLSMAKRGQFGFGQTALLTWSYSRFPYGPRFRNFWGGFGGGNW